MTSQQIKTDDTVLSIRDLSVSFHQGTSVVNAVDHISLDLKKGQCLGIVGESGSGKSVTSLSILDLISDNQSSKTTGSIVYQDHMQELDLLSVSDAVLQKIRGRQVSIVFQEPMSSLNPVIRCGQQVKEVLDVHNLFDKKERKEEVLRLFRDVRLEDPARAYRSYPHELSGGQLQRVNIAMAIAGNPQVLICDEPTTALDVTVQKEIVQLLKALIRDRNISMIFVCHDLDLVAEVCDSVAVMYQGKIVESGMLPETFNHPTHLYTKALLRCKPRIESKEIILPTVSEILNNTYTKKARPGHQKGNQARLISVRHLTVRFLMNELNLFSRKKYFLAVDDISFDLNRREILGIVGESGSGKSTVANCLAGLLQPTKGRINFGEKFVTPQSLKTDGKMRRAIQLVFQDPYNSLNPKMRVGACIAEPIKYHRLRNDNKAVEQRVIELLGQVGLGPEVLTRYPHELSGGQRQRVCIARSLSVEPELLICDESVSALDVSVQAQILNLLDQLRNELNLSMIFISHDLAVIHYISDRVIVMHHGKIVEEGHPDKIMKNPSDPYTQELINSIPNSTL